MSYPKIRDVQRAACEHYGVTLAEMLSPRRASWVSRNVAMYLARRLTTSSLPQIGRAFGRDHSTVYGACRRIERLVAADPILAADVAACERAVADGRVTYLPGVFPWRENNGRARQ
jgi:chromosomal replication initiator protein